MTDIKPTVDMAFDEALKDLTGFEIIGIQSHYGEPLEKLGGIRSLLGAIWAYRKRTDPGTDWKSVERMTLREIHGFFAEPEIEDDEAGKGESTTPNS